MSKRNNCEVTYTHNDPSLLPKFKGLGTKQRAEDPEWKKFTTNGPAEIKEWLEENEIKYGLHNLGIRGGKFVFLYVFTDESDAIGFKLRWSEI